ncbi:DUF192 domain-containing protein [Thauera linaloolentis]|uniref:DUF192 domain-containing protein n=1 Tax=Thauera linaloolentis (strain DSM 12138 / JCM 21573 / CCUG 41526 / CIP 105981 / IAM 15112 / NBRC 102519 / 47Lol) TaxID=1123367 RepID=N6XWL8_THAL4|nr:DUF192 domain-containing protein [Thauera linaloolentis]ENO83680.1 hypothetical protein C666_18580 [Thauera linaloolentis 47Lol = DSM 12138]MCM8565391.1 DUF192 domain-containing protein [Thauera linaloolentis]
MKRVPVFMQAMLSMAVPSGAALAQAALPVAELGAGMYRIEAEVAHTPQTRQLGLMNRKSMPLQRGMVFVFDQDTTHCMWMKNTWLPLSVAFVDAQGKVINIEDMQPHTEDNHCAAAPARYALEMNLGWFRERGIEPGDTLRGFDRLPPAR